MTITYTHEVANSRLGGFSNLLLRWRGSVYKLFYKEFLIYIFLYTLISISYRVVDSEDFKEYFEKLCLQFQTYTDLVPISFVLGFYVSVVVTRWWQQFSSIPWPDRTMMLVASNVHGSDHRGRLIRRTLMRYLSLAEVLTYRSISTSVYKRFPTMQHVIEAGFMTPNEYKEYERVQTDNVKYFVPLLWFSNLLSKARQEGRIYDDITYQNILKEMNDYRSCCGTLFGYDWISIPLVYTQVVTVAVYVYFISTLLSRQYLNIDKDYKGHEVDLYVPIFTIFQFFFYVGWLKVAEQLINPFGEDDDDFEVNMIIDRNIEISLLAVDKLYFTHPKLEKDMYWNNPNPSIPHTAASANHKVDIFLGSTMDMSLNVEDMRIVNNLGEVTESAWELGHDYNHNRIDSVSTDMPQSPPSYSRASNNKGQKKTAASNPINIWLKRIAREDSGDESKLALLEKDGPLSQGRDLTQVKNDDDEFGVQISDEDSVDSDIGHGGGSEDEGTDYNHKASRSSLSSIDDEDSKKSSTKRSDDGVTAQPGRKHTIEDPEDKPIAKKPKSIHTTAHVASLDVPTTLPSKGKRKQESLKHNASEGNLKSLGSRFTFGRGKKSPKRKLSAPKLTRKSDFGLPLFGNVDDERLNAQIRNFNLQKNMKRKSVVALQRNARRMKYPGNTWLRQRNPHMLISHPGAADYASMTSGTEDKPDFDSPFGSVNSFATSVPSPRPLRFSHFGKQGQRLHRESMCSSCMTSPGVHDEFSPFAAYSNPKPSKSKEESGGTVAMPFTEDLRRRLRVVSASSPASSKATSPLLMRTQLASQPSPYRPHRSSLSETDDQQIVFGHNHNVHQNTTTWDTTLEAIGEISHSSDMMMNKSLEVTTSDSQGNSLLPIAKFDSSLLNKDQHSSNLATQQNIPSILNTSRKSSDRHTGVNRSRICPLPVNSLVLSLPETHSLRSNMKTHNMQNCAVDTGHDIATSSSSSECHEVENTDGIILEFTSSNMDGTDVADSDSEGLSVSGNTQREIDSKANTLNGNEERYPIRNAETNASVSSCDTVTSTCNYSDPFESDHAEIADVQPVACSPIEQISIRSKNCEVKFLPNSNHETVRYIPATTSLNTEISKNSHQHMMEHASGKAGLETSSVNERHDQTIGENLQEHAPSVGNLLVSGTNEKQKLSNNRYRSDITAPQIQPSPDGAVVIDIC